MGSKATKLVAVLCVLIGALAMSSAAAAAPFLDGTFPLNAEIGTNSKIVDGPDGNVWLTIEDLTNDVAKVTPSGQVEEFDIEGILSPEGIAPGPDGNLWVTDVEKAAKFNPGDPTGTDQSFTVPGIGAGGQIVAGPDGLMWVATNNQLVHFSPGDPEGSVKPVTIDGEMSPKGIDVAGSLIVIADNGTGNRIVTFTPDGTQKDFAIDGGSQGVAGGPGGQIAFTAPGASPEKSGLISPPNPAQSFELLGDPFGVDLGADGAYWIVQFMTGQLTRVSTDGQLSFLPGLPVESARQITAGPNGTLWVTLQKNELKGVDKSSVVKVSGVEAPKTEAPKTGTPPLAPETKIGKGPKKVVKTKKAKAKVKFRFSSPAAGATFECSLTRLKGKKTKAGAFKGCKSPKAYKLRPGKYRFQVRAVIGGIRDATPAFRKFKIVHIR
jgi:virginiamycin B lyase